MESTPTPLPGSSPDEMFPALTAQQQARVLARGRSRKVRSGETIVEPNAQGIKFFLVGADRLELLLLSENKEAVIALCGPSFPHGKLTKVPNVELEPLTGKLLNTQGLGLPKGGLEPPRVTSHAPQTCASTSSATSAQDGRVSKTRVSACAALPAVRWSMPADTIGYFF